MAKKTSKTKAMRKQSGLNQKEFWKLFGVTQSGGSRYENGRAMPKPVKILMKIGLGLPAEARLIVEGTRGALRKATAK